ncbi:MAG: S1/P1 nuclease [Wenzhouxiangellaceae bacterium]|nr:S1/P1 nuclease [Wenzhouxiangellaceae bacterium]
MKKLVFVLYAVLASTQAFGWGATGHRVAAEIADGYLSAEARLAVNEILGPETLAEASTWPDFMRADPAEFWQETANPWHYVTVPPGKTYEDVGAPEQGDAASALQKFTYMLRDAETSGEDRKLALRFLVHIIGDLHQPLHVGNGEDRGGNDFEVTYFGEPTNLHRLWDSQLIDSKKLSYTELTEWLGAKIGPAEFRAWNTPDPMIWMAESAELRERIYPEDRDLRWGYGYQWTDSLYKRLQQAGVRTAAYLNELFGD